MEPYLMSSESTHPLLLWKTPPMNDAPPPHADSIPQGYLENAAGHLVPMAQVREADLIRDEVARRLAKTAQELNAALRAFKSQALSDMADLIAIAGERYDVKLGGKKGNIQITTYDGRYKIARTVAERITFTEEMEVAKALINRCIDRWSQGASPHIRALVDRAFRTDTKGQIKTSAILELLRLSIEDPDWENAMAAIGEAIQVTGTATYIRVYRRIGQSDQYEAIPLDLASV
jgi:hypothetical protein